MRNVLGGYLYKLIVVGGILALAALVSADIWLWQRDNGAGRTPEATPGARDRFELPGLPSMNAAGGADDSSSGGGFGDTAGITDSVDLVVRDAAGDIKKEVTVK